VALVLFVAGHVLQVARAGLMRNLRSMVAGK